MIQGKIKKCCQIWTNCLKIGRPHSEKFLGMNTPAFIDLGILFINVSSHILNFSDNLLPPFVGSIRLRLMKYCFQPYKCQAVFSSLLTLSCRRCSHPEGACIPTAVVLQACVNGIDSNVIWLVPSNEVKWDDISLDDQSQAKYPFVRLPGSPRVDS